MLDGGIIQRLLEEKWKTFAQNQFLKRLLIHVLHLLCLSVSIYMRPSKANLAAKETDELDGQTITRYLAETATILGVLSYVILQQGDEVKNQGLSAFLKGLGKDPAKAIFLVSNFLLLACIPCRMIGNWTLEEKLLIFAAPGSWFFLMFFAG